MRGLNHGEIGGTAIWNIKRKEAGNRQRFTGGYWRQRGFFMMLAAAAQRDGMLTLWETGFNSLLIVLGLAAIFCPSARLTEESMPEAWVRENRIVALAGRYIFCSRAAVLRRCRAFSGRRCRGEGCLRRICAFVRGGHLDGACVSEPGHSGVWKRKCDGGD